MSRRSQAARTALLLSAALVAQPATAQEGVFQMLGRLILGAGAPKVAIETPQAVTVLTEAEIDRAQPNTLAELFKAVPGVTITGASARVLGQAFNIRGIGNADLSASEERIKVTVDGAPTFFEQYRMGSFFGDLDLYKRVEVLRGPSSSTLYGSGAVGGVVAFTTKDASDFLTADKDHALVFKGGATSNGGALNGGVTYAQRAGGMEFLANANRASAGRMQDGAGNDLLGTESEVTSGLVKGKFALGEGQSLTLTFSQTETDLQDSPVAQTGGATVSAFGTADIFARDQTASIGWAHEVPGNDLLNLSVQLARTEAAVDKSGFSLGAMCAMGTFQVLCDSSYAYATTSLKVENRADLAFGAWKGQVIAGVQLTDQTRSATSTLGALAFHPEGQDQKAGVYLQGEFVWNDRLTITPGLRVDFSHRTPSAAAIAAGGAEVEDRAVSPKIAAMYQVNDSLGLFGTLARTERMPTLDELYSYSGTQVASLNLDKEEANSAEIGVTWKGEGLLSEGDSLQAKATAFSSDLTNMVARNSTGAAGSAYYVNIDRARIEGAEIEAAYDSETWFGGFTYARVVSKNLSTGAQLADTPATVATLTARRKFETLSVGWRGSVWQDITTASATTTAGGYQLHDLFLTWTPAQGALEGVSVSLAVENVFDATYRNNLALDNGAGRNLKLSVGKTLTW